MNLWDLLLTALLLGAVYLALRQLRRTGCNGQCGQCRKTCEKEER